MISLTLMTGCVCVGGIGLLCMGHWLPAGCTPVKGPVEAFGASLFRGPWRGVGSVPSMSACALHALLQLEHGMTCLLGSPQL